MARDNPLFLGDMDLQSPKGSHSELKDLARESAEERKKLNIIDNLRRG